MQFSVNKKTGFYCYGSPSVFSDGELFYFHKGAKDGGKFYFNLPKGNYFSEKPVYFLPRPINSYLPKLPKRQVFRKKPKKVELIITPNKNKCSIDLNKHKIYLDPEMKKKGRAVLTFILFHEIGHYFYKDENLCDLYAAREMIKRGFNPSQCGLSINSSLSDMSFERKKCLIKNLK